MINEIKQPAWKMRLKVALTVLFSNRSFLFVDVPDNITYNLANDLPLEIDAHALRISRDELYHVTASIAVDIEDQYDREEGLRIQNN